MVRVVRVVRMVRVVRALVHELIKTLIPLIPRMFHHFYGKHSWDKSVSCFLSLSPQLLIFIHTDFTDFTDFASIHGCSLPYHLWDNIAPSKLTTSPLPLERGRGWGFFLSILSHRFHRFHRFCLYAPVLTIASSKLTTSPLPLERGWGWGFTPKW